MMKKKMKMKNLKNISTRKFKNKMKMMIEMLKHKDLDFQKNIKMMKMRKKIKKMRILKNILKNNLNNKMKMKIQLNNL